MEETRENESYDVVVIGGGAAGLSGAVTLARARRSVAVVDAGEQRNRPAAGVHGFLTRDGIAPGELVELGRDEVERYGGVVLDGRVTAVERVDDAGLAVVLEDGRTLGARRVLLASGLVDELPDVPGLRELWGTDVVHCPYCHGYEIRDEPIGILSTGPHAVHLAQLFRQWSADVTLFVHTGAEPTPEEAEALAARGITVVEGEVAALETEAGRLRGVRLADGEIVARRALVVAPTLVARADVVAELGLATVPDALGTGRQIETTDMTGKTSVPGVWAAGNVTAPMAWVTKAASDGVFAGAGINQDLIAEDTRLAVAAAAAAAA